MVQPIKNECVKNYSGNGLRLNFATHTSNTVVIGNFNKISMAMNAGTLNVIGNRCTIRITSGSGRTSLVGNHSKLVLGQEASGKHVCIGNNTRTYTAEEYRHGKREMDGIKKPDKCHQKQEV